MLSQGSRRHSTDTEVGRQACVPRTALGCVVSVRAAIAPAAGICCSQETKCQRQDLSLGHDVLQKTRLSCSTELLRLIAVLHQHGEGGLARCNAAYRRMSDNVVLLRFALSVTFASVWKLASTSNAKNNVDASKSSAARVRVGPLHAHVRNVHPRAQFQTSTIRLTADCAW